MSVRFHIIQRNDAAQRDQFDKTFAELPDVIRNAGHGGRSSSSASLWLRLLRLGDSRTCNFWIARSTTDNELLARIGGDISEQRSGEASIGFFDCKDSPEGHAAGRELVSLAVQWLAERHAKLVFAPMDFNSWFNYRFKIRDPLKPHQSDKGWEPAAPSFHRNIFIDSGFMDDLEFSSFSYEIKTRELWNAYIQVLRPDYDAVMEQGYLFRPIATGADLTNDLQRIFDLSNIAFAENPMFEKIPFEIFALLTGAMIENTNMEASRVCLSPQGGLIGFVFCFTEQDHLIYKTVAVHPDHRSRGIANAFTHEISMYCMNKNITKTTGALLRSGNTSERIGRKHGQFAQPSHTDKYVLMKRSLK